MARPSKRLQVSGERFLLHRMESALLHIDIDIDDDSPRAQWLSLIVGVVAAAVAVALSLVLATFRPQPDWGGADVVMVGDTGAVYVRIDDVVHPVANLVSAQLITGAAHSPRHVTDAAVRGHSRGPLLGITGAPPAVGAPLSEPEMRWTVCDHEVTTVIVGATEPGLRPLDPGQAVLVTGSSGSAYLLYDGSRARVDVTDTGLMRALGAEGVRPATVTDMLLDMVPEVAPISTPLVPHAGLPGPSALPGFVIGDVVAVHAAADTRYYVVLDGGVQEIGKVAADVLRHQGRSPSVTALAPAALDSVPEIGTLAVQTFPGRVSGIVGDTQPVCASWSAGSVELLTGAVPRDVTRLPQADGAGPNTDAVHLAAGRSVYLADGTPGGSGWLVTEPGSRFRVADAGAARVLVLPEPIVVPRAVLQSLPPGPQLSRSAALTPVVP